MKTLNDYLELRNQLVTIKQNHDGNNGGLDATFIKVRMFGKNWRLKKQVDCVKDFDGWYFFTTSTNSNGYGLYEKIKDATKDFKDLEVSERQL